MVNEKKASGSKLYLSDATEIKKYGLNYLSNTIFHKTVPGIGGTHLFLNGNEHAIALLPFVNIVDNKSCQGILSIKEGVTENHIVSYLKTAKVRKIVSTYDGLSKLNNAYNKVGLDLYKDFLLIDEWQVLLSQYKLRRDTMKMVLSESVNFERKCFMTATPPKREYWFKELESLEECTLVHEIEPIDLYYFKANSIIDEAIETIMNIEKDKNIHIFINSVQIIISILRRLKLSPTDVRIVCSDRVENEKKMLPGYTIESTTDPVKKFNFYTSTAFEGCDIFDKNGKIVVLSDGRYKEHTIIDLKGTLYQIAKRIRDIEDPSVMLIYNWTEKVQAPLTEYSESRTNAKIKACKIIEKANNPYLIGGLSKDFMNEHYIFYENGKYIVDEVLFNLDIMNFEILQSYNYDVDITTIIPSFFNPIKIEKPMAVKTKLIDTDKVKEMSFKEACIAYDKSLSSGFSFDQCFDPIVVRAVNILTIEKLIEMDFHKGNITKALIGKLDTSENMRMVKLLKLKDGLFYTSTELLIKIKEACTIMDINPINSATYIEKLYEVKGSKSITKTINRKKVRGYTIMGEKSIFDE